MPGSMQAGSLFLLSSVFDLYLFVLAIRVILAYVNADYYHPVTQFVVKLTDFIIKPLRRIIPNMKEIEVGTLLVMLIVAGLKFFLLCSLSFGTPNVAGIGILAVADSLRIFLQVYFYALLLQAIISWVQPGSATGFMLNRITAPLLTPIQKVIPPIAGIDVSPIPALLLIQFIIIIAIQPLLAYGLSIAI